jgi:hypothetical protein
MKTIPTRKDIESRRIVRFARGHLAARTTWVGVVTGYNAMYDTVSVYVYESPAPEWVYTPGDTGWLTKTTYARADVEWFEPAEDVEVQRDILRKAAAPRTACYDAFVNGSRVFSSAPWGVAMASAQKSIRNGATVVSEGGGVFRLMSPDGATSARFVPSA